jgi:RNA polymerase sigma factor (sigma-70 family)
MAVNLTLLKRCTRDERKAQHQLYQESYGFLKATAMRYLQQPDDVSAIINTSFLKILNGLKKFLEENPADKHIYWSKRILINVVIDDFRKNKKYREQEQAFDFNGEDYPVPYVDWGEAQTELTAEDLENMLLHLPELRRKVFNLFAIDGYKHQEIAALLDISEGNSKWHVSVARKQLQALLAKWLETKSIVVK